MCYNMARSQPAPGHRGKHPAPFRDNCGGNYWIQWSVSGTRGSNFYLSYKRQNPGPLRDNCGRNYWTQYWSVSGTKRSNFYLSALSYNRGVYFITTKSNTGRGYKRNWPSEHSQVFSDILTDVLHILNGRRFCHHSIFDKYT